MGLTLLGNPPYGKGRLHKKIFNEACKYGEVHFLQPVGAWRTHVGNIEKLYPLHTSVKMFNIVLMTLGIHTNLNKNVLEWDTSKVPTVEDYEQGTIPLKMRDPTTGSARMVSNTVPLSQQPGDIPLKTSGFNCKNATYVNTGIAMKQVDLAPLGLGGYKNGKSIMNLLSLKQEKIRKTCIFFNSKRERTNFIKNISKIIALQILYFSGLFPTPKDRIMPPVDREYSKDELLDYFNFPKDVYKEFDDIEKEEPNSHYTSYERWRDWRKEKYGLDWDEE